MSEAKSGAGDAPAISTPDVASLIRAMRYALPEIGADAGKNLRMLPAWQIFEKTR